MPQTPIAASASGNNELVAAPGAGRFIRVLGYSLSSQGNVDVEFRSSNTTKVKYYLGTHTNIARFDSEFVFDCAENEALNLNLSGVVAVGGEVRYALVGRATS